MNVRKLSVNKACIFLAVLLLAAMVTVSVALYALTQDITAVWYVLLFGIFVLFCSICFMVLVRRKLAMFSDAFCSLMDDMLSGNMQPKQTVEEESLFYKIEYRLNRLYEVMQENKNSIAQERADLQELISDISHQVKTPIANLKVINSTLLENEIPVQKQKEFLTAQATQLDKLDFLMQAMIKTSRLETGVISLEKKSQPLYDTLAAALGGILLNAEKKQINVQVDCPESLIVSHDRKWTGEALFNILDNAVKYTPEGGQIRVSVESWEMYVKIDIADRKAIKLSLMGIPIGLLLGWPIGRLLLPAIVNMLTDDIRIVTTVNPLIFLVAIVFSAITVFISCQKPAILAAKVSPMEALHYIEQTGRKKKQRCSKHISTMMMAKNNLTRNKKKVMIVTLSFALSIVLLNSVYTYVTSFDFDKFVADFSLTDFTVSDTTVINNYAPYNTANVSQDFISQAESLNGLEDIGNIYLWTSKQPLSENDLARLQELSACSSDIANELENYRVRQEHGVNVYGLDDFPAEYVQVLDGELNTEQWKAGTGVYVTPLRMMGDGSLCLYKPGDQISVTQLDGTNKVYDVLAVVSIPSALQTPLQVDMGLDYIFPTNELLGNMVPADQPAMKTIFNVDHEHQLATENWLKNYTTNTDTALDYLSKVTLRQTFDGMINMYRLVGGALCAILALIGILNFINSITTSILSRYREIAMLQSIGMTGRQVKQMLIYEGIGYSILGLLGSLILSVIASLTVVRMMGAELTSSTWHFTLIPVFLCIIPLILITAIVPLVCYNKISQKTVVDRLRIAE